MNNKRFALVICIALSIVVLSCVKISTDAQVVTPQVISVTGFYSDSAKKSMALLVRRTTEETYSILTLDVETSEFKQLDVGGFLESKPNIVAGSSEEMICWDSMDVSRGEHNFSLIGGRWKNPTTVDGLGLFKEGAPTAIAIFPKRTAILVSRLPADGDSDYIIEYWDFHEPSTASFNSTVELGNSLRIDGSPDAVAPDFKQQIKTGPDLLPYKVSSQFGISENYIVVAEARSDNGGTTLRILTLEPFESVESFYIPGRVLRLTKYENESKVFVLLSSPRQTYEIELDERAGSNEIRLNRSTQTIPSKPGELDICLFPEQRIFFEIMPRRVSAYKFGEDVPFHVIEVACEIPAMERIDFQTGILWCGNHLTILEIAPDDIKKKEIFEEGR